MNPLEFDLKQIYQIYKHDRENFIEYHINQHSYLFSVRQHTQTFLFRIWGDEKDHQERKISTNILYDEFIQNLEYLVEQIGYVTEGRSRLGMCREAGCEKNDD